MTVAPFDEGLKQAVADKFTAVLREWLTREEFAEMVLNNGTRPEYAEGSCASQDYCDANMAMHEAILSVTGRETDAADEGHAAFWDACWNLARDDMEKERLREIV